MDGASVMGTIRGLINSSSRMLQLREVDDLCGFAADAIVEYSFYRRCVVSVRQDDDTFARLGFGGLDEEEIKQLQVMQRSSLSSMEKNLDEKFRLSSSYYIPHDKHDMDGLKSKAEVEAGQNNWHPEDFLFIPLYNPDGSIVGLISVDEPSDGLKPTEEGLLPLELFATQLASLLENQRNQKRQSETMEQLRQQQEVVMELSTPVIQIWEKVLVLPLIGTVDSRRALQIMENVLIKINETQSSVVIIDITGVPVIDTLVASNLIKTVSAAKLLGATTIITGINPEVAQTLIHLGIELSDITTKSNLSKGIEEALRKTGRTITTIKA